MGSVIFFRYVISKKGVIVDQSKVEVIRSWLKPKTLTDARSFHDLVSFYRRFMPNFNTIMVSITKRMKTGSFEWTSTASKTFKLIKQKLCEALILALPNFNKLFKVECDVSEVGISVILTQSNKSLAYFSEKINDTKRRYSIYDKQFYVVVRALDH